MNFFPISQLTVGIPATTNTLIVFFLLIFVMWLVHMFITVYHWKNYGNNRATVFMMEIIYFCGSAVLFAFLVVCLSYYSLAGTI